MKPVVKALLFLVLLIVGLLALAMSVCGGGFLLLLFRNRNAGGDWLGPAGLAFGSLALGLAALFGIWQAAKALFDKEP